MVLSNMVKMRMRKRQDVLNKCVRALPSFQQGAFDFPARFIKTQCSRGAYQVVRGVWRCLESTFFPQLSAGLPDFVTPTGSRRSNICPATNGDRQWLVK